MIRSGVKPGDTIWTELYITGTYAIEKPGRYRIQVSTRSRIPVESNVLFVTVADPPDAPKTSSSFAAPSLTLPLESLKVSQPISLFVATRKKIAASGSDVRIELLLTNETDEEITLGCGIGTFGFRVLDSAGNEVPLTEKGRQSHLGEAIGGEQARVNPDDDLRQEVLLGTLFDLNRPGKYTVQAWRKIDGTVFKSNTADFTIAP